MSASNISTLLSQLTGHMVRVVTVDGRLTGTVAALTDELLVLAHGDDVIWVDLDDIVAVRVLNPDPHTGVE